MLPSPYEDGWLLDLLATEIRLNDPRARLNDPHAVSAREVVEPANGTDRSQPTPSVQVLEKVTF